MARQAGLDFTAWDTPEEWDQLIEDMPLIANPLRDLQGVVEFRRKHQNRRIHLAEYEKVKQHCRPEDTVLIARHRDSVAALIAAEQLGIPIVSVFTAPSFLIQMLTDEEMFGDMLSADVNSIREEVGLPPVRSWIAWVSSPKRSIGLWPEWFAAPDSSWPVPAIPVGFPLDHPPQEGSLPEQVREMLNGGEPPILITGGTSKLLRPEFYAICAEACRLSNRRGILVTKHKSLVPDRLPDGVRWFQSLSFVELMPHTRAIIHHGGIGTLSQAMAAGIPQLVLAEGFDRPDNAARLKQLGVAECLPPVRWKPDLIAEALDRIMAPNIQEHCRDLAQRLLRSDFAAAIGKAIEEVISNSADFMITSADFIDSHSISPSGSRVASPSEAGGGSTVEGLSVRLRNVSPDRRALLAQVLRQRNQERLSKQ
jgi:UDP:flavonoid glycosyltransferase YjiC (YdhE family)